MDSSIHPLNTVCPYYTMFPLDFPKRILRGSGKRDLVADPYCGRGTTIYAARLKGIPSYGVDTSPVAVAISRAKLAVTTVGAVTQAYDRLMSDAPSVRLPEGPFWKLAFHDETLLRICQLRSALRRSSREVGLDESSAVALLRAVALGALHGPLNANGMPGSYFSNQMLRTFAPKPDYAVRFWKRKGLKPKKADLREVIRRRTKYILDNFVPDASGGRIVAGDSQEASSWSLLPGRISRVITSPPYYGMNTYEEDQWLRLWFLGGSSYVKYGNKNQLSHNGHDAFARAMAKVWDNVGDNARPSIRLAIRFGAIGSHKNDYYEILINSLKSSKHPWRLTSTRPAGHATQGRRQAMTMGKRAKSSSIEERDFYVCLA